MSKLPRISGQECVKALAKIDFYRVRRSKGNHIYLRRDTPLTHIAVPDHRELHAGTLRSIINQAGLTVDEFLALL